MSRVVIVGTQRFSTQAIQLALRYAPDVDVLACIDEATADVAREIRRARPDVVVVDGLAESSRALRCLAAISAEAPGAVVLAVASAETMRERLEARPAELHVLPTALAGAAADSPPRPRAAPLTSRELETLRWVAEGHTNARIARRLWVTEQTVKFHLTNIYRKLGVANRTEASRYALRHGLLSSSRDDDGVPDVPDVAETRPAATMPR